MRLLPGPFRRRCVLPAALLTCLGLHLGADEARAQSNSAPMVANAIADRSVAAGASATVRLERSGAAVFADSDGDALTYSVSSGDTAKATVTVDNTATGISNAASALKAIRVGSRPAVTISGVPEAINRPFTAKFTFAKAVKGFAAGDIGVTNANLTDFTGTGSESDGFWTTFTAPAVPAKSAGLIATAGDAQVALSWTDPGDSSNTKWQERHKTGSAAFTSADAWTDISGSDHDTASHTVTGLTNGTTYRFEVRAVNLGATARPRMRTSATPNVPGLTFDPTSRTVAEDAGSSSATVVLDAEPTGNVTVTLASSDATVFTVDDTDSGTPGDQVTLTFTADN